MQKIIPNIWFDSEGEEAAQFYVSLFENSKIHGIIRYDEASAESSGKPVGAVLTVDFVLDGMRFTAINGGTMYQVTPANSFFVNCASEDEIQMHYDKLAEGGSVLMPFQEYPFAKKYAWIADRYGISWQLFFTGSPVEQKIIPALLFVGDAYGRAEEAMQLYTSLLPESGINDIVRYEEGEDKRAGTVKYGNFTLARQQFIAMDSGFDHQFSFTGGISYMILCETQEEIDELWEALLQGGEEHACGWITDKFGVMWQVTPSVLLTYITDPDPERAGRVMKVMMTMKKLEIAPLQAAFDAAA